MENSASLIGPIFWKVRSRFGAGYSKPIDHDPERKKEREKEEREKEEERDLVKKQIAGTATIQSRS